MFWIEYHRASVDTSGPQLGVTTLILHLRDELELLEQQRLKSGKESTFRIKDFDLEVNFVVKVKGNQKNGLNYEIVTAGTGHEFSRERSDKITLHMEILPPEPIFIPPSNARLSTTDTVWLPPVLATKEEKR
jgi:hypothetical protein